MSDTQLPSKTPLSDVTAWLAAIVASSDDAILGKALDGAITSWNPAAERLYGYTSDEVLGRPVALLVPPERGDEVPVIIARIARGEHVDHFETVRVRKDGSRVDVSLTLSPIRDASGAIVGISTIARDISAQMREVERRLEEAQERFDRAFHASPVAMTLTTLAEFRFLDVNERCCHLTGYGREEFLGRRVQDMRLWLAPGVGGQFAAALVSNGRIGEAEVQIVTKAGEVRDMLVSVELIGLDKHQCALATIQDITDRKRADEKLRSREQQYRLVTEHVRDVILTIDEQGCIVFANESTERLLGYDPAEMLGKNITELIPLLLKDRHAASFGRYVLTNEKHVTWDALQVPVLRKDGREIPAEISFGELVLEGRRVFTGVIRDVTERQATEKFRNEVLDVISHELRTPVTVIQGYAELMGSGALKPDSRAWHDARAKIERSSKHLGFLLTSLVELSKLREGGRSADPTRLKTIDLFTEAATAMDARRPGPSRVVTAEVAPGAEEVLADRRTLLIALVEFLDNAAKYSPQDAPIFIRASLLDHEVLIEIEDRGQGIPEHIRKDIFKPFVQADSSSVRKTGGVGLGLAVAHGLVKAQGGRVEIKSEVGKGTTVRIVLPREPAV